MRSFLFVVLSLCVVGCDEESAPQPAGPVECSDTAVAVLSSNARDILVDAVAGPLYDRIRDADGGECFADGLALALPWHDANRVDSTALVGCITILQGVEANASSSCADLDAALAECRELVNPFCPRGSR